MRTLFSHEDLKRMAGGVAVASIAGLLMGAALRPNLDEHDASGPQMVMGAGGPRAAFAASDAGVGAYSGQLPEYVVGTDWTRPRAMPAVHTEPAEDAEAADARTYDSDAAAIGVVHRTYVDEPQSAPRYPSTSGNAQYEANLPGPPEPPADLDDEPAVIG